MILTSGGEVPIEVIQPGDRVITRDQYCPDCPVTEREVTEVFERDVDEVLWITLANGDSLGTTPGHLVWSNESGWVYAGDLCVGSTFMTTDHHAATVVDIVLDPTPTKTYNFAVADTGTYFANGLWVHNTSDNCKVPRSRIFKETFDNPEDAIGITGQGGAKRIDVLVTDNEAIFEDGFTITEIYLDEFGDKWTVHYNPKTGIYAGSHASGGWD